MSRSSIFTHGLGVICLYIQSLKEISTTGLSYVELGAQAQFQKVSSGCVSGSNLASSGGGHVYPKRKSASSLQSNSTPDELCNFHS